MSAFIQFNGLTYGLRVNPSEVSWTYDLVTNVIDTYGGRITQILSVNMDGLNISGDCGMGGSTELRRVQRIFTDMVLWQKDSGKPGYFSFPEKNWRFSIYAKTFGLADNSQNVAYPYSMSFAIHEDETGLASADTLRNELDRLQTGIGYTKTMYNDPGNSANSAEKDKDLQRTSSTDSGTTTSGGGFTASGGKGNWAV